MTSETSSKPVSVLLVDDSAVIRSALSRMLTQSEDIEIIGSVSNGELGVSAAARKKPDIIILDIEMPVMDGLTAIPEMRRVSPDSKIVMFSSLTEKGAQATMKALSLGAVECVAKPNSHSLQGQENHFETMLTDLVLTLGGKPAQKTVVAPSSAPASDAIPAPASAAPSRTVERIEVHVPVYTGKPAIVAIGSSTGGPQALFTTLKNFEDFDVPVVITQHMPATFTKILAEHIQNQTPLTCHEGEEGMVLEPGHAYVAPGGRHMIFEKNDQNQSIIHLDDGPPVNFCKPAVDPMMLSLIKIYGNKILGVILTGMGCDGRDGAIELMKCGGRVVAQDKETSVVWGMPGAVAEAGACQEVLPLPEIGPWVKKTVLG